MRKIYSLFMSLLMATAVCGQEKNIKVVDYVSGPQVQCFIDALGGPNRYTIDSLVILLPDFQQDFFKVLRDCCEHGRLTGIDMSGCHTVTEIPAGTFMSSMVNAKPHGAARAGEDTDLNMNLRYIKLPNTIKTISDNAFMCSNLEQIELPAWIEKISFGAFVGCNKLKNVMLRGNNQYPSSLCDYFSELPSDAVLHVAEGLGEYYRNDKGWSVFGSVEEDAGLYCAMDVTLGAGVTLKDALGENNMNVDRLVVNGEPSLADMELLKKNVQNGWLTDIDFSGSKITCGELMGCMIQRLRMPTVMTKIPEEFFSWSEVMSFTMPEKYEEIGYDAFEHFGRFADSTLVIPEGCRKIGYKAFENCRSLKKMVLPSTMEELEPSSLHMNNDAYAVPELDLYVNRMYPPASLTTCSDLSPNFRNDDGPFGCRSEQKGTAGCYTRGWRLFVPVGAKANYENAEHWDHFVTIIETPLLTGEAATGISETIVTGGNVKEASAADGIYTIDGRLVTKNVSAQNLPKGMYIVKKNGVAQKVIMRK